MLEKQRAKIQRDRKSLHGAMNPELLASDLYTHNWLLVNSRCFYWDYPTASKGRKPAKRRRDLPPDECMALCPFADYFNHADHGCDFHSDATGCWITADRDYNSGEELYVSYGAHSNDFLLVEYGFVLAENKWDLTKLDVEIIPQLNASQRQVLEEFNLLGNYSLDKTGVCYRTQAALRGFVTSTPRWRNFLSGAYDGDAEQDTVGRKLGEVLARCLKDVHKATKRCNKLKENEQIPVLMQRWSQIAELIEAGLSRGT